MSGWLAPTETERILSERQFARVQAAVKKLSDEIDDEMYEAIASGKIGFDGSTPRVRYLQWCREQGPRWMAESLQRAQRGETAG